MSKINKRVTDLITAIKSYLEANSKLENIDTALLESLESSYKNLLLAEEDIAKNGLFTTNRFGDKIANPAVKIANDAKIQMNKALEHLDVTVKLRCKNKPADKEEESPLEAFLKG